MLLSNFGVFATYFPFTFQFVFNFFEILFMYANILLYNFGARFRSSLFSIILLK